MNPDYNQADIRSEFYELEARVKMQRGRANGRRWQGWAFTALGAAMIFIGSWFLQSNGSGWTTAASAIWLASGAVVFGSGLLVIHWNRKTFAALAESEASIASIREREFFD